MAWPLLFLHVLAGAVFRFHPRTKWLHRCTTVHDASNCLDRWTNADILRICTQFLGVFVRAGAMMYESWKWAKRIIFYLLIILPERFFAHRTRERFFVCVNVDMTDEISSPREFFPTKIAVKEFVCEWFLVRFGHRLFNPQAVLVFAARMRIF